MGVLSSVPSQAAPVGPSAASARSGTASIISGTTTVSQDSTTAAVVLVNALMTAQADSLTVSFVAKATPAGSTVVARMTYLDTGTAASTVQVRTAALNAGKATDTPLSQNVLTDSVTAGTNLWMAASGTSGYSAANFMISLDSAQAIAKVGTYTWTVIVTPYTAGTAGIPVSGDVSTVVTDGTDGTGATAAAGTSTAVISSGTSYDPAVAGVDDVVTAVASSSTSPAGTEVATIKLTQLTSAGLPARESITVTTNIGNIGLNDGTSRAKSATFMADTDGIDEINIYSDGTSGAATINVKTTSVTFAAKTVTFYSSSVDKYTVTRLAKVIGSATTTALVVTALDSSGNIIKEATNSTVYAYSDNLDAISTGAGTTTAGTSCSAYNATLGGHFCSLAGSANGVANITIRNKSTLALSTKSSTAQAITVNMNPAVKIALSFDKATYAPGELAYLSLSAVDAAGNPVGPNAGTNYLTAAGITGSAAFGNGSAGSESLTVSATPMNVAATGRVTDVALYTVKLYMPASGGTITASATGGTALSAANQVKVTASATVTDSGAAALAAVTALATTVASLKTLITTLTNLVLKIQKKVKA
jgi:hypothetical protein